MSRIRIRVSQPSPLSPEIRSAPRAGLALWRSRYDNENHVQRPGIFVMQAAYENIRQHVTRIPHLEVGGMLVGQAYRSPANHLYIIIEDILEAQHIDHSPVHVTFTSDTLSDMHNRLEATYPDKQIVGWYHTHPGLSLFLSSWDVWLHTHFFPQPWHVALVVDPRANHGGFFTYQQDHPGHIDAYAYSGFYEMGEPDVDSVVTWGNLQPGQ